MERSATINREARARRRRCSACDQGGDLHPCRGCGLAFHADAACSGRRVSRHASGAALGPGAALLCAACARAQCLGCSLRLGDGNSSNSSSGVEAFAAGCHAASGGCGHVFHTACLTFRTAPASTDAADAWRCEECDRPDNDIAATDTDGEDVYSSAEEAAARASQGRRQQRIVPVSAAASGKRRQSSRGSSGSRSSRRSSSRSATGLSLLARRPQRRSGSSASDSPDQEAGPGIPSDESDDWDSTRAPPPTPPKPSSLR
jgi:hypothetical protein